MDFRVMPLGLAGAKDQLVSPAPFGCGGCGPQQAFYALGNRRAKTPAGTAAETAALLRISAPSNSILANDNNYSPAALKLWSMVLVSFGATVTFWSCSPSFS